MKKYITLETVNLTVQKGSIVFLDEKQALFATKFLKEVQKNNTNEEDVSVEVLSEVKKRGRPPIKKDD